MPKIKNLIGLHRMGKRKEFYLKLFKRFFVSVNNCMREQSYYFE